MNYANIPFNQDSVLGSDWIFDNYPYSAYAAWVLFSKSYSWGKENELMKPEEVIEVALGKKAKEINKYSRDPMSGILKKYRNITELNINSLPDSFLRSSFAECFAISSLNKKEFKKAMELFTIGAQYKQRSRKFIEAIKRMVPDYDKQSTVAK